MYATEQYDTFVKFSHDQVEKRLAESAFSCKSNLTSSTSLPFTPSSTQQMCLDTIYSQSVMMDRLGVIFTKYC